jgi:predicted metal-dependent peptidase
VGRLLAELAEHKASLDWHRALRLFASTASATWLKDTLHRRSKCYGTVPGFRIKPRRRLAVALDTSASIGGPELAAFVGEMRHIWRAGARSRSSSATRSSSAPIRSAAVRLPR